MSSTHTMNVPVLRREMSGLVCGQDTDDVKWIRRESGPKGRFSCRALTWLRLNFTSAETSARGGGLGGEAAEPLRH